MLLGMIWLEKLLMLMKKKMINYSLISKSQDWPARFKKIKFLLENILKNKKTLKFSQSIDYNLNIILSNDKLLKKMNNKYRNKNKSTDVLTFVSVIKLKKNNDLKVCDIFISAETLKVDAKKNNINFYNHLAHIFVHSFLHINGYVHKKIKDFNQMKKIEIQVLNKLAIENPYR